ncbi:MAG TPA: hypothetical protein VGO47_02445, partial [Chlamydiales bacterium]|nr:hypothetical protein [Chlamydiales bacterium]
MNKYHGAINKGALQEYLFRSFSIQDFMAWSKCSDWPVVESLIRIGGRKGDKVVFREETQVKNVEKTN